MAHNKKALLLALTAACLFFSVSLPSSADEPSAVSEVRMGFITFPGYSYSDSRGRCVGADVEYGYKIAQTAGFKGKMVLLSDVFTAYRALADGTVDMLFDNYITEERKQKYIFSDHPVGSSPMSVFVRSNDDRFDYGRIEQLKGILYGGEAGSHVNAEFKSWCKKYGFVPQITEYKTRDELYEALSNSEIDAGVMGTPTVEGFRTIQNFSPIPYYIMFRKNSVSLKERIDSAMEQILSDDPLYPEKLVRKYTASHKYAADAFTRAEKYYIAEHLNVSVAVIKDDEPYYYRTRSGEDQGIIPAYFTEISQLTGLQFSYQMYDSQDDAERAVKQEEADVLGLYSNDITAAYEDNFRITEIYKPITTAMITRSGTFAEKINKIAITPRGYEAVFLTLDSETVKKLVKYNNALECFDALKRKKVDAIICGMPTATWIINQTNSPQYSISAISSVSFDLCGAVNYNNKILASILDKAIRANGYRVDGIITNNTLPKNTLRTFIARIPVIWLALFSIIVLVLLIVFIVLMIMLARRQKERVLVLAEKADTDREKIRIAALEKTAEERNQFFSNISHDMRTPLNAVIGYSALAEKEQVSPKAREYISKIQTSGNLLLELVNDTLTISKVTSGKLNLKLDGVFLHKVFDSIIVSVRIAAEKKQVTLTADCSALTEKCVMADRLNLEKILLNLLSNAIKYTPEGGTVVFTAATDGLGYTVFTISDNGIGISKEFLPHIYEPFSQEKRIGYESTGTGLGLSIVKHLVDMMNGTIDVVSEKNKGTTFTLRIPFKAAARSDADVIQQDISSDFSVLAGKTILVCEDNDMNREIAEAMLKSKGMSVVMAKNGKEGVDLFSASAVHEYCAILMDLRMPVMDGYAASKSIRSLNRVDASVPIIAMTADVFEEDVEKCFAVGMNGHIAKPINPENLFSLLKKFVQ